MTVEGHIYSSEITGKSQEQGIAQSGNPLSTRTIVPRVTFAVSSKRPTGGQFGPFADESGYTLVPLTRACTHPRILQALRYIPFGGI
jgi:hypothetical protein